jgi:hypothetical protein
MQIKTDTGCTVGLRVGIDQQCSKFKYGKTGSQVNG